MDSILPTKEPRLAAAYVRVSTVGHGQDVANQIEPIKAFALSRGFSIIAIYEDVGISGSTERRKGLDKMVHDARQGKFQHVIVVEISRLARDVRHLLNLLSDLDQIGTQVVSIREGIEFKSAMGRAMVAMIGILMSVERELLSERIKAALYTKKKQAQQSGSGWRCGRPPKINSDLLDAITKLRASGSSIRQIAKALSISKTTVLRALTVVRNRRENSDDNPGVKTRRKNGP